jgi:hypothetical protein
VNDWRADRIQAAREGRNPTVLRRLRSGWAVIGDHQRLPGYCLLLHDGEATVPGEASRSVGAGSQRSNAGLHRPVRIAAPARRDRR